MASTTHWYQRLVSQLGTIGARQASWTVALRNAIGVTLPLATGLMTDHQGIGLAMAVGALTVMFSDQPGPYRQRLAQLLLASLAGAVAALVGLSLGAYTAVILPLASAWVFAACLLVALGPAATRVGLTSIIVLLITSSRHELGPALPTALMIFAGGLFQALLAVLAWPLDRHRPERRMLAEALASLAASTRGLPDGSAPPPESDTIDALQSALISRPSQRSATEERFFIVLREYEQIRLALAGLSNLAVTLTDADKHALDDWLDGTARVLQASAQSIRQPGRGIPIKASVEAMDAGLTVLKQQLVSAHRGGVAMAGSQMLDKLARHVRVVARNSHRRATHSGTGHAEHGPTVPQPERPLAILRANLQWHATAFRHALRCTVVVGGCLVVVRVIDVPFAHWLPMTAAIVLKPDFGATVVTGILRMTGTLAGLLLMTVALHFTLQSDAARIAAMVVLCFAYRDLAPRHYGIAVMALSGMLVLMLALAGEPAMPVVQARALATVGGCLIALAAYLIWPSWERARVRQSLAAMLYGWSDYLGGLRQADEHAHARARRAARAHRSNAQASLERLRQEPRTGEGLLANGEAFMVAGNRLARAAMHLDALLLQQPDLRQQPELQALLDALARHTRQLAERMLNTRCSEPLSQAEVPTCADRVKALHGTDGSTSPLCEFGERFQAITAALDDSIARLTAPH